ncbi:hypothetical protein PsYK624_108680 [Phanerochaete sordida]|uniref:Uncharacterized protein n=1 Tax=Phanerochaete sordida TaxID=48140 RepID=A0A9P3GGU2_9APHY|nr:hypothetical protein PsYK624_108680 [Phanerochaete sordida]
MDHHRTLLGFPGLRHLEPQQGHISGYFLPRHGPCGHKYLWYQQRQLGCHCPSRRRVRVHILLQGLPASRHRKYASQLLYVTRVSAIVADSLAFILTLMKTLSQVRAARRLRGVTVSLSSCIARDGTIYFAALVALNIARLIVSGAPIQVDLSPVTPFLETLPQILINRFIINLRHVADPAVETDLSQASTLGFRIPTTMLGNIAEPLEDGTAQDSTDERLSLPMSSTVYDSEH